MAARNLAPVRALVRENVIISGSFAPAGAGAPTAVKGRGFTVSRTGTGTFLVTFADKWADVIGVTVTLQLSASANTAAQVGNWDAAAKTLVIRTLTAGTDADIAANANNRIHFDVNFTNTARP